MTGFKNTFTCTTCSGARFKCPRVFIRLVIDLVVGNSVNPACLRLAGEIGDAPSRQHRRIGALVVASHGLAAFQRHRLAAVGGPGDRIDGHEGAGDARSGVRTEVIAGRTASIETFASKCSRTRAATFSFERA